MNDKFIAELSRIVPPKDGGNKDPSVEFSNMFQEKNLALLDSANPSRNDEAEISEKWFNKLRKDPLARSRLENIHSARAFKHGFSHLGSRFWYREKDNLAKKLKTQSDRRKFRMGLKADVDFINQLNILDFEEMLKNGNSDALKLLKMQEPVLPAVVFKFLENAPPIKILELVNARKAADILTLVRKISSMAHFCQSMADYFAHDDALEPALAVVCEILRNNEDAGAVMEKRATTFLGMAQSFQKLRSPEDHDVTQTHRSKPKNHQGSRGSDAVTSLSPRGFCFRFQRSDACRHQNCRFIHKCSECESRNHGAYNCTKKTKKTN